MINPGRHTVGGFLELELPQGRGPLHVDAIALHTGRACLAAVLAHQRPRRVYLPFFICHVVVEVIEQFGIECRFYELDEKLLPVTLPHPGTDELVLLVNYFGIQSSAIRQFAARLGKRCIVDCTQAFFDAGGRTSWAFFSARKFFGVPDGAYLSGPEKLAAGSMPPYKPRVDHLVNRMSGLRRLALRQYRQQEARLDGRDRRMSALSERLLAACDYDKIAAARRSNYLTLDQLLSSCNRLDARLPDAAVPYCYPLVWSRPVPRSVLAKAGVFVPTLWQEVIESPRQEFSREREVAACLLPLPIDQRYSEGDMLHIVAALQEIGVHPEA